MRVLFYGGTWHGRYRELPHLSRRYIVPVKEPLPPGTIEDFNLIDIDEVWNGRKPTSFKRHVYSLTKLERDDRDILAFVLDAIEDE